LSDETDEQVALKRITENESRTSLLPHELASAVMSICKAQPDKNEGIIAKEAGIKQSRLSCLKSIQNLPDDVKGYLSKGTENGLSEGTAYEISRLCKCKDMTPEDITAFAKEAIDSQLSQKTVRERVDEVLRKEKRRHNETDYPTLLNHYGRDKFKVVTKKDGSGSVTLIFDSHDDLLMLLAKLVPDNAPLPEEGVVESDEDTNLEENGNADINPSPADTSKEASNMVAALPDEDKQAENKERSADK
jgi:hypothetical protein